MKKVLIIATSRRTRGGITSVIKAHEQGEQWKKYHCKWIEAHIDTNRLAKIAYFFHALCTCVAIFPFYDIIHIHHAGIHRKFVFFLLAKLYGKKVIAHLHACDPDTTLNGPDQWMYRFMYRHSSKVIVLSKEWKEMVHKYTGVFENVEVVYNPCPLVNALPYDQHKKYILYAGTVTIRKGYDILIEAFAKVASKYSGWKVIIAGNGEIEKGEEFAKKLNISDRIQFTGWISGKEKDKIFREAGVFCLSSTAEGFPMGVLDAWAYGVPVITTPVGGITDVAKDGKNLLLCKIRDVSSLAECIDKLLANAEYRNRVSAESFILSKSTFSLGTISTQLDEIYQSLYLRK